MASVFSPSDGACGVFASPTDACGDGTQQLVSFARAAHLLYGRAPTQDARGELVLSFVGIGSFSVEWQPMPAAILRQVNGIVVEIAARAFAIGTPDIRELDRCYDPMNGKQLEVVQAAQWGNLQMEIDFRHIGR